MGENFTSIFMNAFGDFSLAKNDMSFIHGFLFFSSTFIVCLIMMNLFIGILSVKLEEVLESRAELKNEYSELCLLICQLQGLIISKKASMEN
jgi:hypothetical protein